MPQPDLREADLAQDLELVAVTSLRPHPRNYRDHPEDQLAHLKQSLTEHGVYRNVVIARDNTILAGHGVVKAAAQMGLAQLPVRRLDLEPDDERALKILIGDNEIARLATIDDRALTELLGNLRDADVNALLGTGFDDSMLSALLYTTRPASEIADKNTASQWVGMPEYDDGENVLKVIVSFRTAEDRVRFAEVLGLTFQDPERTTISTWWPPKLQQDDLASLQFEG